jgi:FMN-dependent NADH-azoreductase
MPTLLRIDSSPLGNGASFTRQLTDEFVKHWQATHPGGRIVTRDLATINLAPLTGEWIGAAYTPETKLAPQQREALAVSNELIAELQIADEYVVGVPMHNFSIPGTLKLWIDQIVRAGKTFAYENGAPRGLLTDKKATFLVASGGVYDKGSAVAAMNFVEPYLRSLFAFIGVTESIFISAGGVSQVRYGVDRAVIVEPALASIQAQFQTAQAA